MRNRKRLSRVFVLLLCISMLFSSISVAAFAADSDAAPVENAVVGAASEAEPETAPSAEPETPPSAAPENSGTKEEGGGAEEAKHEAESKKPEAESAKPEAESAKPEAESSKQETESTKPETESSAPGTESAGADSTASKAESTEPDGPAESNASSTAAESEAQSVPESVPETAQEWNAAPITGSASKDGVTVRVSAPAGSFPEGTTLQITPLESERAAAIRDSVTSAEEAVAFDISFHDRSGAEVQPREGTQVDVKFSVDGSSAMTADENEEAKLQVFHVEDDGSAELLKSVEAPEEGNGAEITVSADSFSVYMLTKVSESAAAPALRAVQDSVITEIEAQLQDGSGPVGDVDRWQVFRLNAKFALPNGQIHAGDTTTITLPEQLRFNQTAAFEIKDEAGNVVANAVIDGTAKTITLTYTDYAEKHSDISGSFFFYVQIDRSVVTEEQTIPLVFDVSGRTVYGGDIHFIGIQNPRPAQMDKSGWQTGSENPRRITYQIRVNTQHVAILNAVISDQIQSEGITIDQSSLTITKGNWVIQNGDWSLSDSSNVTSNYTVNWGADGTSFTIDLGDISETEGFQIRYYADASYDLADGEVIRNTARLTGENVEERQYNNNVTYYKAGGSAEGYVYRIRLTKKGEDGSVLSGAEFNIIRVSTGAVVATITTDASGEAEATGLLKDDYQIVEVKAPDGYELNGETINVSADDFNSEKLYETTVLNRAAAINIDVAKTWVGPAAEKVTVNLFADGTTIESFDLNAENNWQHIFANLPKYSSTDGHEIVYTLEEPEITNYRSNVGGSAAEGFTVTNTNIETIEIPVTKAWIGPAAESVTVKLLADGTETAEATLTEEGGWKYTFTDLPKYSSTDGHEIVYTLEEPEITNYRSNVGGSAAEGFTVTNTNIETIEIPVTKAWIGPAAESVTVKLLADGTETAEATLTEEGEWKYTFTNLPKYSSTDGHEIAYTVQETAIENYDASVTGNAADGFAITNTNTRTGEIPVEKKWVGDAGDSVTIHLLADGEVVQTATITEEMGWKYTFTDLPLYDSTDGHAIRYAIREDEVAGYTSEIRRSSTSGGFVVTNTKTPTKTPTPTRRVTTTPAPRSGSGSGSSGTGRSSSPRTGDTSNIIGYALLLLAAGGVLIYLLVRRRRNSGSGK